MINSIDRLFTREGVLQKVIWVRIKRKSKGGSEKMIRGMETSVSMERILPRCEKGQAFTDVQEW